VATFQIGEVERLLGIKAHVLRYWEKEIPLLRVRKDLGGRRVYTERDVALLYRLRYLLYGRRFTLEGAREQLIKEASQGDQNLRAQICNLRADLLSVYFMVRNMTGD
jgi:DNA-binding transcriptional MerR regulator